MSSGFLSVLAMSALLGGSSFIVGMLPLSFTFSRTTLARLSTFGTGLLLGAALGVVIPEGVETIATAEPSKEFPTRTIALSLILGFTFMLLVERIISRHSHSHPHPNSHHINAHQPLPTSSPEDDLQPYLPESELESDLPKPSTATARRIEFDVELGELERAEGFVPDLNSPSGPLRTAWYGGGNGNNGGMGRKTAYPLTIGLVVHALADGLALGSSALSNGSAMPSSLSTVVFLALIIHKAPTALGLSTSLLSTSLSRSSCRKHLAIFSASTPLGALTTYGILTLLGVQGSGTWSGIALLVSGGTFLYVATVLQPGKSSTEEIGNKMRVFLTILGILVPTFISLAFGDVHEH